MNEVQCADCGFLAVRDRKTRELAETELGIRRTWDIPTFLEVKGSGGGSPHRYEFIPVCFAKVADFDLETRETKSSCGSYDEAPLTVILEIINRPRECDKFMKWEHGLTPREPQEMLLNAETIERQAAANERRDRDQREWQQKMQDRQFWRTAIVGLISVVVGALLKTVLDNMGK